LQILEKGVVTGKVMFCWSNKAAW